MLEDDIRPDALKKDQESYIAQDIAFLHANKKEFVEISCPACGMDNKKTVFTKIGFEYKECSSCRMLYMSPRPTQSILGEFYSKSANYKYFNDYIFPASKEARRKNIFIPRVDKVVSICKEYGVSLNSILEIGAGFGIFCEELAKRNIFADIVGLEATDALYETTKDKGFKMYNGILEDVAIQEKFNVVVSFEVIEHVMNPLQHLAKINSLLLDGGVLLMTFPNYDGFDISVLGMESDSIDHEHLNYFNEKAIKIILENSRFELLHIETPGKLDVELVRKKILSGEFLPGGFIRNICVDNYDTTGKLFQEFIQKQNLSSHMLVSARKV
ncbi:MAG: class I SAM-dependent methyltransferase [Nitrospirae bacterium]|nr:class I SAM-dependent methyltransferase [Nitrospirota bacterium]